MRCEHGNGNVTIEVRCDISDGQAYTKEEFVAYYGTEDGEAHWRAARFDQPGHTSNSDGRRLGYTQSECTPLSSHRSDRFCGLGFDPGGHAIREKRKQRRDGDANDDAGTARRLGWRPRRGLVQKVARLRSESG